MSERRVVAARRMRWRSLLAFAACAVVTAANVASVADAAQVAGGAEQAGVQAAAVQSYMKDHGVAQAVAEQRIQLQDSLAPLLDDASGKLADSFAGMWYDASDDGKLVIAAAAAPGDSAKVADGAQAVFDGRGVGQDVRFVAVRSTWQALTTAQSAINQQLRGLLDAQRVDTLVDPSLNAVVVETASTLTPDEMASVSAAAAAAPVAVRVEETSEPSLGAAPSSCSFQAGDFSPSELFCDPELRGGPMIGAAVGTGHIGCTAGFVVLDLGSLLPEMLTAGHCNKGNPSNPWSTRFSDGSSHAIGSSLGYTFGSGGDYGSVNIDNPAGWGTPGGHTYVWVDAVPGQTTQDSLYQITQAGHSALNATICSTAGLPYPNGYHTACGSVTGLNVSVTYTGGVTVNGLGRSNACAGVEGSSGGPFYKNHVGYGLMSGFSSSCVVYYQGLIEALNGTSTEIY